MGGVYAGAGAPLPVEMRATPDRATRSHRGSRAGTEVVTWVRARLPVCRRVTPGRSSRPPRSPTSPAAATWRGRRPPTPSAIANLLPWHGQTITPSATDLTLQPWCVQVAEKALNSPAVGWVTTTSLSANTVPPPTGMLDGRGQRVRAATPAGAADGAAGAGARRGRGRGARRGRPPPQAVSSPDGGDAADTGDDRAPAQAGRTAAGRARCGRVGGTSCGSSTSSRGGSDSPIDTAHTPAWFTGELG